MSLRERRGQPRAKSERPADPRTPRRAAGPPEWRELRRLWRGESELQIPRPLEPRPAWGELPKPRLQAPLPLLHAEAPPPSPTPEPKPHFPVPEPGRGGGSPLRPAGFWRTPHLHSPSPRRTSPASAQAPPTGSQPSSSGLGTSPPTFAQGIPRLARPRGCVAPPLVTSWAQASTQRQEQGAALATEESASRSLVAQRLGQPEERGAAPPLRGHKPVLLEGAWE
nr:vegetative cell wall protein gp1-like [Equus caballus]